MNLSKTPLRKTLSGNQKMSKFLLSSQHNRPPAKRLLSEHKQLQAYKSFVSAHYNVHEHCRHFRRG